MAKRRSPRVDAGEIASALRELATLMELTGENPFKVRAHESAARAIEGREFDVLAEAAAGTLGERRGFGPKLVEKVSALIETGRLDELRALRRRVP